MSQQNTQNSDYELSSFMYEYEKKREEEEQERRRVEEEDERRMEEIAREYERREEEKREEERRRQEEQEDDEDRRRHREFYLEEQRRMDEQVMQSTKQSFSTQLVSTYESLSDHSDYSFFEINKHCFSSSQFSSDHGGTFGVYISQDSSNWQGNDSFSQ
ncbi:MAG: hypothetical protein ACK5NY_09230 [Burkholderiaceae bacterium]